MGFKGRGFHELTKMTVRSQVESVMRLLTYRELIEFGDTLTLMIRDLQRKREREKNFSPIGTVRRK